MKVVEKARRNRKRVKPSRAEFIDLGWRLLELRYRYYCLDGDECPSDHDYDLAEQKYVRLAKALGEEPAAANMVDFDYTRPSCCLAACKVNAAILKKYKGKWPDHLSRPPYEVVVFERYLAAQGMVKTPDY